MAVPDQMAIQKPWWRPLRKGQEKTAALILSSGDNHVYSGAIFEYQNSFLNYLHLEDMGIYSAYGKENGSEEKLAALREFGRKIGKEENQ